MKKIFTYKRVVAALVSVTLLLSFTIGVTFSKYTKEVKVGTANLNIKAEPTTYVLEPGMTFNGRIDKNSTTKIIFGYYETDDSGTETDDRVDGNIGYKKVLDENNVSWESGVTVDAAQSGAIRYYEIPNGDGTYTGYVLSRGNIQANPNSANMFENCSSLTNIEFGNFDTSQAQKLNYIFQNCSSLPSLDLTSFDTSSATTMDAMFNGCTKLTQIKGLEKFNTSNVTSMAWMFQNCSSLTKVNLLSFDTTKVWSMFGMFGGCKALTTLDLSSFSTETINSVRITDEQNGGKFNGDEYGSIGAMFADCTNLRTIYVGDKWDVTNLNIGKVTDLDGDGTNELYNEGDGVFVGCNNLVGGSGTTLESLVLSDQVHFPSSKYACVDDPNNMNNGLLTKAYEVKPLFRDNKNGLTAGVTSGTSISFGNGVVTDGSLVSTEYDAPYAFNAPVDISDMKYVNFTITLPSSFTADVFSKSGKNLISGNGGFDFSSGEKYYQGGSRTIGFDASGQTLDYGIPVGGGKVALSWPLDQAIITNPDNDVDFSSVQSLRFYFWFHYYKSADLAQFNGVTISNLSFSKEPASSVPPAFSSGTAGRSVENVPSPNLFSIEPVEPAETEENVQPVEPEISSPAPTEPAEPSEPTQPSEGESESSAPAEPSSPEEDTPPAGSGSDSSEGSNPEEDSKGEPQSVEPPAETPPESEESEENFSSPTESPTDEVDTSSHPESSAIGDEPYDNGAGE